MRVLKLTAPVCALIVAACGSPAAQAPANKAVSANEAAPAAGNASAAAGPLSAYIGRLPSDEVAGVTFLANPLVQRAVEAAVSDAEVRRWVLRADVTSNPIASRDGRLIATGCESHNCGPHHWTVLIDPAGTSAEICYARNTDLTRAAWYAGGRPAEERPGDCPTTS